MDIVQIQSLIGALEKQFKNDVKKNTKDVYYVRTTKASDKLESIIKYITLTIIGEYTIYNVFEDLEYSEETKKILPKDSTGHFSLTVEGIVQSYISSLGIPDLVETLDDKIIWSVNIPAAKIIKNLLNDKNYLTQQVISIQTKNSYISITGGDTDDTDDTNDTNDTNNIHVEIATQFNGELKVKRYDYDNDNEGIKNLKKLLYRTEQILKVEKINFETRKTDEIWTNLLPTIYFPETYFIRSSLTGDLNNKCNEFQNKIKEKIKLLKSLPYVSDKSKTLQTPEEKKLIENFTNLVLDIWNDLFETFYNGNGTTTINTFLEYYLQEYLNTIKNLEECIDPSTVHFFPKHNVIHGLSIEDIVSKTKCDINKNIMLSIELPGHSNLLIISHKDKKLYKLEPNIQDTEHLTSVNVDANKLYTKYAKQSGYKFEGQWNSVVCSLKHAGLCVFISHFSFIYGKNITNEILKDNIVNFFKWLLNKICNQQLCDNNSNLSNDEIVVMLKNQEINKLSNHLKIIVAFLLIVKISREHLEELIPLVIERVTTNVKNDEYSDITEMLNSVYFKKMKECLKSRIKIIINRLKNEKYLSD